MESDHNFYTGFAENISAGGLFIATRDLHPIGTTFSVAFTVPTYDREVRVECEVRWQRLEDSRDRYSMPGIGVRFVNLGPVEERAINEFIKARGTLFYDEF